MALETQTEHPLHPTHQVNMLDMFELPTELLPYFFVVQTLMMEGVIPWVDLSGILIGYAWQVKSMREKEVGGGVIFPSRRTFSLPATVYSKPAFILVTTFLLCARVCRCTSSSVSISNWSKLSRLIAILFPRHVLFSHVHNERTPRCVIATWFPFFQTLSLKGLLKAPKPLVNLFKNNAFLRAEYAKAGKEYGQDVPLHDDDEDEADNDDTVDEASEDTKGEAAGKPSRGAGKSSAVAAGGAAADREASSDAARKNAGGQGAGKGANPVPEEEDGDDSGTEDSEAEGGRGGEYASGESEELADVKEFDEEAESMLEEFEGDLDTAQDFSDSSEEDDSDSDDF